MPPKYIKLKPGEGLPSSSSSGGDNNTSSMSVIERALANAKKMDEEKKRAENQKIKIISNTGIRIPRPRSREPAGIRVNNNNDDTPTTMKSPESTADTVQTTPSTTTSNLQFDDDCDLCNEKCLPGEVFTTHTPVEHAFLNAWMSTISSEASKANFLKSNPKNNVSPEKAKEIGQLAIEIAKKKDGGPLVWNAALNVWKQIKSAIHHKNLELRIFGSCVAMGTWDGVGDVDLCYVRPAPQPRRSNTSNRGGANNDDDSAQKQTTEVSFENYNMESVSDQKKEVLACSRLLRDAGFAFDDLEPVLHARVPIVKHHHSAPDKKDRSGWESIATRSEAKSIVLHFSGTRLPDGIVEMLSNQPKSRGHWENNQKDFVVVGKDTNEAVENYLHPWRYFREMTDEYEQELKTKIETLAKPVEDEKSNNNKQNDDDDDDDNQHNDRKGVPRPPGRRSALDRDKYTNMKEADSPENQKELDQLQKYLFDVRTFTRGVFERCLREVDWYSNKFFHFPELFHCDFDLSFRAHGIRNSILLRAYFSQTPLARVGALLVKQWSKDTAVNLSMRGYFTTYCINIVWLAFLINKKIVKWVDPTSIPVFVTDEQFENEVFKYIPTLGSEEDHNSVLNEPSKIGNLLFEFFFYYGYEFDWTKSVVTLRQDTPFDREKVSTAKNPWTLENEIRNGKFRDRCWYRLCVDDPYEPNLSLGRHLSSIKAERILTHFRMMAMRLAPIPNNKNKNSSIPRPLISTLKPDTEELTPAFFRQQFVRWFVGHKSMPLQEFIKSFISCDEQQLMISGSANTYLSLSKLLAEANAGVVFPPCADRTLENADIELFNPTQNYISKETFSAVLAIEKELFGDDDKNDDNDDENNTKNKKEKKPSVVLITKDFAKKHHLRGNYIAPLKTFFEFTDMFSGDEFRVFRTREALDEFLVSTKRHVGANVVSNSSGSSKDRRDASRSWIGTCGDCGYRQRRLYQSAVTKDKTGYCEACWDAFEKM